jgi:hypothetical protein
MLGKLLGGLAAVTGCTMAVLTATRGSDATLADSLPPLLVAAVGVVVFVLSGRALARHPSVSANELKSADRLRMNVLVWGLLLIFVLFFLIIVWFLTGGA